MIPKLVAALLALILAAGITLAAQPPTDGAINDNVRIRLSADAEVKGGALKVAVDKGVVTITGAVETQRQKDKATKLAKKVKGVKQVVNNITVKEKTGGK
jgi:hyperosmotically inducible periplasmic protein